MSSKSSLNIVYSTDDNYAQHAGVSVASLLDSNKDMDEIVIYIIENNVSHSNKKRLQAIVRDYGRSIQFVDFSLYKSNLYLNSLTPVSLSSYGRLFITEILPSNINTVIYLDCDVIVAQSLRTICEENIEAYYLAAVQDSISNDIKATVGMDISKRYINAGMLVINLKRWRMENIQDRLMEFLSMRNGNVVHQDQGVINGCLNENIKIIHPKYNAMTPIFTMSRKNMIKYYNITGDYYTQQEIDEAVEDPVIIHFTPGLTCRPWEKGCRHPKRNLYIKYLRQSPWKDYILQKESSPYKEKCVKFIYKHLPYWIADSFMKSVQRIKKQ